MPAGPVAWPACSAEQAARFLRVETQREPAADQGQRPGGTERQQDAGAGNHQQRRQAPHGTDYPVDTHRIGAAVGVTLTFVLIAAVAAWVSRRRLHEKPRLLDATRTELARDVTLLKGEP